MAPGGGWTGAQAGAVEALYTCFLCLVVLRVCASELSPPDNECALRRLLTGVSSGVRSMNALWKAPGEHENLVLQPAPGIGSLMLTAPTVV